MKVLRYNGQIPNAAEQSVLALGNFDAVHLGHQAVLETARRIAQKTQRPLAVMTFEPHPRRVFNPDLPPHRIVSFADKARLLAEQDVDWLHVVHFSRRFAQTTAENFIHTILHRQLRASHIVTGENFTFGHKRLGNTELLKTCCAALDMGYTATPTSTSGGQVYSSSAIREALSAGDPMAASSILGRPYRICRRVIHGDQRGRTLGYPTANLPMGSLFCPRHGVYAIRAYRENHPQPLYGVASLGLRPMFRVKTPLLEVHLFDFHHSLYGERLAVEPLAYLREEKIFSSTEDLKNAMRKDEENARTLLKRKDAHA